MSSLPCLLQCNTLHLQMAQPAFLHPYRNMLPHLVHIC